MLFPYRFCVLLLLGTTPALAHDTEKRYPHLGRLDTEEEYARSLFEWHAVGGWSHSDPGFELDFSLHEDMYDSCASMTNLPNAYDDCVTAGVLDPSGIKVFSVGSYSAPAIPENTIGYGEWFFEGGTLSVSDYTLGWQEVFHKYCNIDSPWCMGGDPGEAGALMSYTVSKSSPHARYWYWTDNSLPGSGSVNVEPEGHYYESEITGRHHGYLSGPSGSDFDLYLLRHNGSTWVVVATSETSDSEEEIEYVGPPGYYTWGVRSFSGSGSYQIGVDFPSTPE